MRRRFFLVDNTAAGRGSRGLGARVRGLLEQAGAEIVRCEHGDREGARRATAEAARSGHYDAVIAAGGDGTIRQSARAVAETGMPLGVIPLGTANVLTLELGIRREAGALADMLLFGAAREIRAPTANGEVFLLMAGAGFDGRIVGALSQPLKGRIGKLAYAAPVLRALARPGDILDVIVDGMPHRAGWAVITNVRRYGGPFVIDASAGLERPGLSAVLFDTAARGALMQSLVRLAAGRLETCRHVAVHPCARAEIRSHAAVPVQLDGDAFDATPLVVEANGPRVSLIVPASTENAAHRPHEAEGATGGLTNG